MLGATARPLTDPKLGRCQPRRPPHFPLAVSGLSGPVRAGRCFTAWIPKHAREGSFLPPEGKSPGEPSVAARRVPDPEGRDPAAMDLGCETRVVATVAVR
jgi:hypothetical protein